ncbi:MAG: exosortase A [Novosphingobium sp.]|nr:exosortase A [Novosphingobium sp.]
MPPECAARRAAPLSARFAAIPEAWRGFLPWLALLCAVLIGTFWKDWAAMADQWWNSSTYNHILLIPGIVAWLAWQRAPHLARIAPRPWWPPLILTAGAALLWVLGVFAGLNLARQLGAVAVLITAVLAMMGPRAGAVLAFPLAYMLLMVPFGDELVPSLQMITAVITIWLVHASGIPATIDGVFIATPAGLFEVAEACSGVKFLIAMVALGILVAHLCFRSLTRKAAFLALCVVVPIIANGIRAWGTIYMAQIVGIEAAAGFDHIVYGWIFFAIVIALVLGIAWRFFDKDAGDAGVDRAAVDGAALDASPLLARLERYGAGFAVALAGLAAILIVAKAWAGAGMALAAPLPERIALPEVPGWNRVDYAPRAWWEPRGGGADHRLLGRYADAKGRTVDVSFALYAAQDDAREAGRFGEGALMPGSDWAWQSAGPGVAGVASERLLASDGTGRLAVTWYRTGDLLTASNMRLKLANLSDRLLLRPRATARLILSAEESPDAPAAEAVEAFLRDAGPPGPWMDRVAGIR